MSTTSYYNNNNNNNNNNDNNNSNNNNNNYNNISNDNNNNNNNINNNITSKIAYPHLIITLFAGKLTPAAKVLVAHNTLILPVRKPHSITLDEYRR